ncbi:MAG: hypothetical protein HQL32_18415 [Planctomycetes bacterium]|nr:hypothetical protein [Planctomycetota bacterium]
MTVDDETNRPQADSRTLNGLYGADFTGNDRLKVAPFTVDSSGNVMILIVAKIDIVDNSSDGLISMNGTNDWQLDAANGSAFNGELDVANLGSSKSLTGGPFTGPSVFCCVFDRANTVMTVYENGYDISTGGTAYTTSIDTSVELGVFRNRGASYNPDGFAGEVVVSSSVDTETRQLYEGYLAHKWGLSGNLDTSHPFKNDAP